MCHFVGFGPATYRPIAIAIRHPRKSLSRRQRSLQMKAVLPLDKRLTTTSRRLSNTMPRALLWLASLLQKRREQMAPGESDDYAEILEQARLERQREEEEIDALRAKRVSPIPHRITTLTTMRCFPTAETKPTDVFLWARRDGQGSSSR